METLFKLRESVRQLVVHTRSEKLKKAAHHLVCVMGILGVSDTTKKVEGKVPDFADIKTLMEKLLESKVFQNSAVAKAHLQSAFGFLNEYEMEVEKKLDKKVK